MADRFWKDPQAILDYHVSWATWLGSDTISTSVWTVPTGLTQEAETQTTTTATVWLSGGTDGAAYTLTNHIVTVGGRTDERSIVIEMKPR